MAPSFLKRIMDQSLGEKPKSSTITPPWKGVRSTETISNCFELFGEIEFTERPPELMPTTARSSEDGYSSDNRGSKELELEMGEQGRGGSSSTACMNYADAARTTMGKRRGGFPPTMSTIGRDGKPWLYLKPHRTDGRFVLQVAVVPSHKRLQATREHGRLLLHLSNSNHAR